ncbi:MAG: cytochrome c-type biogenesis protein CcmH [Methyloprofundus sp.]|nr:cytochrome c-type biogenesis protein CcmH [Methyloprofundus sp.]
MFRFLLLLMLFSLNSAYAAIDTYEFKDADKQARFHDLVADLRCPKCQNQNLADSNAAIAQDLRQKIYEMLDAERSNSEIIDYMVARYGDFVLYEPRFNSQNAILWLGPFVLLIAGLLVVIFLVRQRSKKNTSEDSSMALDAQQQKSLQKVLNKDKK